MERRKQVESHRAEPDREARRRLREEQGRKRRTKVLAVTGISAVAAITLAFVFAIATTRQIGATVPDIVGESYSEAEALVEEEGLVIDIDPRYDTSGIADIGGARIIRQKPEKDVKVDRDTIVSVVLEGASLIERNGGDSGEGPSEQPPGAATDEPPAASPRPEPAEPLLVPPVEGRPLYPFTREESIACGRWPAGSQDYPYFAAPRDGNRRLHAGVDLYPAAGEGANVIAMKDGTVIKAAVFYTRYTGEKTWGLLVDHGDFVVNYGELHPVSLRPGDPVFKGQVIGTISGTKQLHLELYSPGTPDWLSWYGEQPANLLDPTEMMLNLVM